MNVVELFSGIGAQARALEKIGVDFDIIATCDWDINAIIAYDIIHNGKDIDNFYTNYTDEQIDNLIKDIRISITGKTLMTENGKSRMPRKLKDRLLYAIYRTNNLINIENVSGCELGEDITIMTYSFPCQDLSLAGNWHNNKGGIDRNCGNRSSLLWEVERILYERRDFHMSLPRFLLMENVSAILTHKHLHNFQEWQTNLGNLGYVNKVLTLDARNFGVPQMRRRTYMLSVLVDDLETDIYRQVINFLNEINEENISNRYPRENFTIANVLKKDYTNMQYLKEAKASNPNKTDSRIEIEKRNIKVDENTLFVPTITTKQDRNPNSGLVDFELNDKNKMGFRYLTPRECFMLMGFDEQDYQKIINSDFRINKSRNFFTRDKLYRMAGNSICVNVLESIFEMINDINNIVE